MRAIWLAFGAFSFVGCASTATAPKDDGGFSADSGLQNGGTLDGGAQDGSHGLDAASDSPVEEGGGAPACSQSLEAACCTGGGGLCPPTWDYAMTCGSWSNLNSVTFRTTPCDGYNAAELANFNLGPSLYLYDADSGVLVATINPAGFCNGGPPGFVVPQDCYSGSYGVCTPGDAGPRRGFCDGGL